MKKNYKSGFTLIELLVVIAIIGILASVVLASLNSARAKGADAAIKANLANARAQAELFYDSNSSSYAAVCTTATTGIGSMVQQAGTASGGTAATITANSNAQPANGSVCHDSASGWVASVALKSNNATYYCVDSTGASKTVSSVVGASDVVCP